MIRKYKRFFLILGAVAFVWGAVREYKMYANPNIKETKVAEGIPKSGNYEYKIGFAEWQDQSFGDLVTVLIKADSIKVIYEGKGNITAKMGEVLAEGIIMKHKSGIWIITHKESDIELDEVGGCTDGPPVIDFEKGIFWLC